MENLAGLEGCDPQVERELTRAKIDVVKGVRNERSEVPTSITGRLGSFIFQRRWRYWAAIGPVPLAVARELYDDPVGRTDIRASGDAGCRPPELWARYLDSTGRELLPAGELSGLSKEIVALVESNDRVRVVSNVEVEGGQPFITDYHIDSEIGLRVFADTLRKHRLI